MFLLQRISIFTFVYIDHVQRKYVQIICTYDSVFRWVCECISYKCMCVYRKKYTYTCVLHAQKISMTRCKLDCHVVLMILILILIFSIIICIIVSIK